MSARRRFQAARAAVAMTGTLAVLLSAAAPASASTLGYDPGHKGSLHHIAAAVGAHDSYRAGFAGKGIGVALIDTGVTRVPGLNTGNVVNGPDLSFDSQDPNLAHLDGYGHGTHLASIIAGRDRAGRPASYAESSRFNGIAPDATLVNVKVGAHDGAVDVTQVIAAIDWVVEHRNDPGLNIRVINLSYGTDSLQSPAVDPLAYAVENAWRKGIVVVVAGGNDGSDKRVLANPAQSPYVIAVGADDTRGTLSAADDVVPAWGTRGDNTRHVDVVAPGVSVHGLRVPGGYADVRNPLARAGTRFARASGTSQAAAVVSGEVALLLQENPSLTPDQVKRLLMNTSTPFSSTPVQHRGNGLTGVRRAQTLPVPLAVQAPTAASTGTGSVELSRGSSHVSFNGVALSGEVDIFGRPWQGVAWASATDELTAWDAGTWMGATMTGSAWSGTTWPTTSWAGTTWTGVTWKDAGWTGVTWKDGGWTGVTWKEGTWTGVTWKSSTLASAGWS
ncbi:serine protease AprX [Kineococcus xinjiangensis]|uniref:Serine protease AprX n=1 Tax=Kineococcus xinjiangensis TaxID=512762 RepID=A0A2S6IE30_9ACTN|nr:S8 family serine peptidase [Kineococcus xinjiangensis]PPK92443.1 serine protease AprX [Kineococcus xinjiangensis]